MISSLAKLERNKIEYGPIDPDYIYSTGSEGRYRLSNAKAMKEYI